MHRITLRFSCQNHCKMTDVMVLHMRCGCDASVQSSVTYSAYQYCKPHECCLIEEWKAVTLAASNFAKACSDTVLHLILWDRSSRVPRSF
jgi:hypothetical protein